MVKHFSKAALFLVAVGAMSLGLQAQAQQVEPNLVEVGLSTAYVPMGFDSNDHAMVMVESYLPNTCYKLAQHSVTVDTESKKIKIDQMAYRYNGICLMVIVPYYHMVDLGILKAGQYEIADGQTKRVLGTIPVKEAGSPNADDFLYAPVNEAIVARNESGKYELTLTGSFTDSCLFLKRVEVLRESKNVITVLPITEVKETGNCKAGEFAFKAVTEIGDLDAGRYMLHVRSLNGQAVAKLFDAE